MDARAPENANDSEVAALAEAMRRSVMETTHEEAIFADALRASVLSRDEELARAMQYKFNLEHTTEHAQPPTASYVQTLNQGPKLPAQPARAWVHHGGDDYDNDAGQFAQANGTDTLSPAAVKPEGQWLVARSQGRFVPMLVSRPTVQRVVPSLPGLSAATTAVRPTATNSNATLGSPVTPIAVVVQKKPRVVLDGMNVGCALIGGGGHRFRSRAIYLALEYYRARGVYAVALLPQNKVDNSLGYSALADNVSLLKGLHEQKRVFFTPAGASDDNFIIAYAMNAQADLVSNDRFRHELGRQRGTEAAKRLKVFLRKHLVPFTFILEDFTPNPNPESLGDHVHHPRDRGYR